jgi:hypothetical protein
MKKFRNPYLVQRLLAPTRVDNPFSFGGGRIDGGFSEEGMTVLKPIFSFDYMGSAEFEWGAVPEAFQKLYEADLIDGFITIDNIGTVWYICAKDIAEDVIKWIVTAMNGKEGYLKERLGLRGALTGDRYDQKYKGWIELDNPFMFFTDFNMFQKTWQIFSKEPAK